MKSRVLAPCTESCVAPYQETKHSFFSCRASNYCAASCVTLQWFWYWQMIQNEAWSVVWMLWTLCTLVLSFSSFNQWQRNTLHGHVLRGTKGEIVFISLNYSLISHFNATLPAKSKNIFPHLLSLSARYVSLWEVENCQLQSRIRYQSTWSQLFKT